MESDRERLQADAGRRAALLKQRAALLRSVRQYFDGEGFVEVDTPAMVPSPGLDLHLDAFEVEREGDAPRYLITSPEYQMKRLLSGGLERIYQVCKAFRRNERGSHHEPEFTMLEWYRAHAGSREVMADTEQLVAHVARAAHQGRAVLRVEEREVDVTPPWPRMTVREAFSELAGRDVDALLDDEEQFFRVLVDDIEPRLGFDKPVFLVDYPASMASLARLKPDDPSVADRFEAYVAGIELCNGFGELTDPVEQRARLERDQQARRGAGKDVYPVDERFLEALEVGMPPSGGNALGVDRLVMLVLGLDNIQDITAIPAAEL